MNEKNDQYENQNGYLMCTSISIGTPAFPYNTLCSFNYVKWVWTECEGLMSSTSSNWLACQGYLTCDKLQDVSPKPFQQSGEKYI